LFSTSFEGGGNNVVLVQDDSRHSADLLTWLS
jgi:hypothetical protein